MTDTRYIVVRTETYESWGEGHKTYEKAEKELREEMENYKFKPNHSFKIVRIQYENCTHEEWEMETDSHSEK